jgi:hypothetical protein
MLLRRTFPTALGFLLALTVVGAAGAQPYVMHGEWFMNRGQLVDIPINGGPEPCFPNTLANGGCAGFLRPANGGIPGQASSIAPVGSGPAGFTIPAGVFGQALGKQSVAVALIPTVIQLATDFSLMGPVAAITPPATATQAANTRKFMASATLVQPARAGSNFSYCPGATTTNGPFGGCATPVAAIHGGLAGYNSRVVYNAGTAKFGGTMAMTIAAVPNASHVSIVFGPLGSQVAHNPVAGMGSQHPGRGYAITDTAYLPPGPIFTTFGTGPPCTGTILGQPAAIPPGCGLITMQGAQLMTTTGPGTMNAYVPQDVNLNIGFPWTTGTVTASRKDVVQGAPQTTTLTLMGTDMRNAAGAGTITLVAGGMSHRVTSNTNFIAIDAVTLSFGEKTPSMSPTGFAVAAVLMVLAVGYAFRRRL